MDLFESILSQFTKKNELIEMDTRLRYTDYYKNEGIEYIKKKCKIEIDDPLIDEVLELEALNIKTPIEEWEDKFGKIEMKTKKEQNVNTNK